MTIAAPYSPDTFLGNDVTYIFPFTFPILDKAHLVVTQVSALAVATVLVEGTNYTVSWIGPGRTGSVSRGYFSGPTWTNLPLATGETLVISRVLPYTQPTDLVNSQRFLAESVERGLDRLEMQIQQVQQVGLAGYAPLSHVGSGGSAHANAAAAGLAGFMTGADKTKLDGVAAGATANVGTVTSVALALPTELTVTGSPVATAGTLTAAWATQTAAKVLASPASAAGVPTFRLLAAGDIPTIAQSQVAGLPEIWAATKEPTGFESPELITQEYNATTRMVTLTQAGGIPYWYRGVRYVLASPWTSVAHAVTVGTWFLRFAGTAFTWAQTIPTLDSEGPVCYVDYNSPSGTTFAIREIHGLMAWQTHLELHERIGTYRRSGGGLTAGTFALNTDTAAAITPGFDSAIVADEDLQSTIPAIPESSYTHLRIAAGSLVAFRTAQGYLTFTTGTYPMVNNALTGAETEIATGDFINVYQILMPVTSDTASQVYRMVFLQPQAVHGSLAAAQLEDYGTLSLGNLLGLSTEFVPYSRLTFRAQAANTTFGKVQLVGLSYLSGSRVSAGSPGGVTPHAPTHAAAGSDPLTIAQSQVTSLTTDLAGKVSKSGDTMTGVLTSTVATGTAPLVVASTTAVANLNASRLLGGTWAIPGAIGATTPVAGAFTTVTATGLTSGRVPFVTTGGLLTDSGNLSFDGTTVVFGGLSISSTVAAATYAVNVLSGSDADRSMFRFGVSSVSNGFTGGYTLATGAIAYSFSGGTGGAGSLSVGTTLACTNATDATTTTNGGVRLSGGLSVLKAGVFGGRISSDNIPAPTIWAGAAAVSTGISVNVGNGGRTLQAMISSQNNVGNVTCSALYLIRLGYDGNNFAATKIIGDDGGMIAGASNYVFSQTAGVLYVSGLAASNHRISFVTNN